MPPRDSVDSPAFLWALIALGLTSSASSTVGPVLLGAYVDNLGLSERQAGLVVATEAVGYAAAQILFLWLLANWQRGRTALLGIGLVMGANLATIGASAFAGLAVVRFMAGVGMGIAYSVVVSSIAGRRRPQRDYAIMAASNLTYAAALFAFAPWVRAQGGLRGLMLFAVGLGVVGCIAGLRLRRNTLPVPTQANGDARETATRWNFSAAIWRLALACLLLYAGHNALWSYQERMGIAAGLSATLVDALLGLSVLVGALGAGLAFVTDDKLGFSRPQWVSYLLLLGAAALLTAPLTPMTFIAAALLVKVGWFYGFPLLQGALANLDPSGRSLVLAGVLQTIGSAIGPATAAIWVPHGYEYVAFTGLSYYAISIPVVMGVFISMDRGAALSRPKPVRDERKGMITSLSAEDVRGLLDIDLLRRMLRPALVEVAQHRAVMPRRLSVNVNDAGLLLVMPVYLPSAAIVSTKLVTIYPHNSVHSQPTHQGVIVVFDPVNGKPMAMMDAAEITSSRTAAVSALATELLARPDASCLAILGTGVQARSHARALVRVRPIDSIRIAGRRPESSGPIAAELEKALGVPVLACATAEEALRGADIVVAATHAIEPVIKREWLSSGIHVNSIGFHAQGCEVDGATLRDALVVVEDLEAALAPFPVGANDIGWAIRDGHIPADHVQTSLGELLLGQKPGRTSADQITLFKSVGLAAEDAMAAALVLQAMNAA